MIETILFSSRPIRKCISFSFSYREKHYVSSFPFPCSFRDWCFFPYPFVSRYLPRASSRWSIIDLLFFSLLVERSSLLFSPSFASISSLSRCTYGTAFFFTGRQSRDRPFFSFWVCHGCRRGPLPLSPPFGSHVPCAICRNVVMITLFSFFFLVVI